MQKIGIMTLKIALNTITSDLINLYVSKMAQMISIDSNRYEKNRLFSFIHLIRIVEYNINCTTNNYLFTAANTTYLNLLLLPLSDNENDMNSPLYLIEKLNSRRTEIQSFITRLDSESFTTIAELPSIIPSFFSVPTYIDVGIDWFYFRVSF